MDDRQIVNGIPKKMNIIAATITISCIKTWEKQKMNQHPILIDEGMSMLVQSWITSRNKHDVNASKANDIAYCLIKSLRAIASAASYCLITINGRMFEQTNKQKINNNFTNKTQTRWVNKQNWKRKNKLSQLLFTRHMWMEPCAQTHMSLSVSTENQSLAMYHQLDRAFAKSIRRRFVTKWYDKIAKLMWFFQSNFSFSSTEMREKKILSICWLESAQIGNIQFHSCDKFDAE